MHTHSEVDAAASILVRAVDQSMYYSAHTGNEALSRNLPCGFDVEQVEKLFPEEMKAYQRWKKVRTESAYKSI